MTARHLTVLLLLAGVLTTQGAASAGASDGGDRATVRQASEEPAGGGPEPEEPEPIPDFWTAEEPASGPSSPPPGTAASPSNTSSQASTSPGGMEPASGTPTTGPGAPVSASPAQAAEAQGGASCDPQLSLGAALRSLRAAARRRDLLALSARPVSVRVSPCIPGTFELAILLERGETVLWRARRELRTTRRATLRLTLTAGGRRFIRRARRGPSRIVRMRLRARLTPAASS